MLFIYFLDKITFSHFVWLIWFLNFYFDLVPFCFLKWNRYFSTCESLPNVSCQFWKLSCQLSIFSAIKYNSSLLFYLKTLYTLVKRHPLKWKLHWRVIQTLRKNWLVVSNIKLGIGKFSPDHIKLWKHHFDGLFLSKIYKVWAIKIQISYLSWDWALIKTFE